MIVALGATAARSLVGRPVTIAKVRGEVMPLADGTPIVVTIHPSYLLRIDDAARKEAEYRHFVADLRACSATMAGGR
jgi:DNA polymerase